MHVPVTGTGIADSTHRISHWGVVGAEIVTDDGFAGYGFTGTHAHLPSDRVIARFISDVYAPMLLGKDSREVRRLWETLFHSPPLQWIGRAGVSQLALSAVDVALWDIKAKRTGVPLWALLGDSGASRVKAYNTDVGWLNIPESELVAQCRRACQDEGFSGVKLKVGSDDPLDDVRRVEAVRSAVGPKVTIAIDANGKFDLPRAMRLSTLLSSLDVLWFEEPLWYDSVQDHLRLAQASPIPIALGEQIYTVESLYEFIRCGAVHFVQPDVTRIGGLTPMLRALELSAVHLLPVAPHAGEMSQVHVHVAFHSASCDILEYIPWIRNCFAEPATVRDGFFVKPEQPGAGTTPTPEALEMYAKPLA